MSGLGRSNLNAGREAQLRFRELLLHYKEWFKSEDQKPP